LHNLSQRKNGPFVSLNCGALPDTLLESELFGYKAGAFTGAIRDKPGRFALADGGTLLLDEIGEVSTALQVRLLRVLQEKTFEPLGGIHSKKVNVRIIAATNRNLTDMVNKGIFRQDLFYRINVIKVDLPPLRQRKEDIPLLVDHFVTRFNHTQGKTIEGVSQTAMAFLMAHNYPGNVRELENIIEHAFVLCEKSLIDTHHMPEEFVSSLPRSVERASLNMAKRAMETHTILDALQRNHYSRIATASDLGINKSTLFRKIKTLGITLPKQNGRSK